MSKEATMNQIDLSRVRNILDEALVLIEQLDGEHLDERTAVESQSPGEARRERARMSQALNLMGDRLELAASLVRVEYWVARGHADPIAIRPGPRAGHVIDGIDQDVPTAPLDGHPR